MHRVILFLLPIVVNYVVTAIPTVYVPDTGEVPYVVVVLVNGRTVCSGSLLDNKWVLTAAHCMVKANLSTTLVMAGALNSSLNNQSNLVQKRSLDLKVIHPSYNSTWAKDDIALLRLSSPFILNDITSTIPVSGEPWGNKTKICSVPGYGILQKNKTSDLDHRLKIHLFNITRPCPCQHEFEERQGNHIVEQWLCNSIEPLTGPCNGDSGAPLVCNRRLWGVTSSLYYIQNTTTCDISHGELTLCHTMHTMNIFMDVYPFTPWIMNWTSSATICRSHFNILIISLLCSMFHHRSY